MEELKVKDLFRGKMGIFMALLLIATVVLVVLKITGALDITYTMACMPFAFDVTILMIYLVAKFL